VDVKRLEIFLKILDTKSLSKAAAALGMAQPSVSASLKTLEDSIGYKLFDRTPRSVKPLPQALILAPYARTVLETLNEATWALGSQSGGPKETLTVGASSVPVLAILPPVLRSFKAYYPNVHIKIKSKDSECIIRSVSDGEFDIGLVGLRHVSPDLSAEVISHDNICLVATNEMCERTGSQPTSLDEIVDWPLIMREDGSGTKAAFLKAFSKRPDLVPKLNIAAEVEGLLPALALARAGLGAAIISGLAANSSWLFNDMQVIPLDFMGLGRNFYLIRRKSFQLTPMLKEFIKTLKNFNLSK
jgi:DNA-binding transcriptional LysR family regulator